MVLKRNILFVVYFSKKGTYWRLGLDCDVKFLVRPIKRGVAGPAFEVPLERVAEDKGKSPPSRGRGCRA